MNCDTGVVLDVLDAGYRLELGGDAWLRGLATTVDRALGDGSGTIAMIADLSGPTRARFSSVDAVNMGSWWREQVALFEALPIGTIRAFGAGPVFYFTQVVSSLIRHDPEVAALLERTALEDYGASQLETIASVRAGKRDDALIERIVLSALEPFSTGVGFVIPRRTIARRPPSRGETAIWGRVAAHLAAALRLRSSEHPVEAVLSPGGKVLDATGPARDLVARDALRAAAISQDRVRSRRGRPQHADEATEQWRALVSGRWSLVDQFESDGRRFLVAKVNDRGSARIATLTARETQVVELAARGHANKLIAYELGVSVATVARVLASAATKLGTSSRVELIRLFLQQPR